LPRLENLDLNLLRTFEAVYAERSITRAAKVLHVTQPAVSNALNRLRDSLGDPLFIRGRKGMAPTTFADGFAPSVHKALDAIRDGLRAGEAFAAASSRRRFRVSMNDPAEALFLKPLVVRCVADAPNIDVLCNFVGEWDMANQMAMGALDVAIEIPIAKDDRLHRASLIHESYACLVRPGHPWAGEPLTMERYLALGHVHVSARRSGLGHVDQVLANLNLERTIKARLRSPSSAADIVRATDFAMTMPERFAEYYGLEPLPLPFAAPSLDWQLYWPARLENDPANQWLRGQLLEIAAEHRRTASTSPTARPAHR
jgi:DNA-binding transcriptional LysR family regulator